ncbi:lipid IV(A) 3-deoxy-D-manno-octulosonic acid transferase [Pasteurella bettyae]|uniref:3-deoxy-D-manno-octulosonic acid transferase n=1 Tax=Pasteurella bettyae CCUG 2042 TaxID=1095749 RepID=I3DJG9_9PAST|nr:lipid IV(A) 3-deoxy-D-manno-octulosonic acid transferase [Pasteurella bettyae]EIJ71862.1 3-deoxy-D-manno-octulosonic-acid transferase [Pasteurella bettyae CCUG 2042]SUB22360.1 3-deoxy-D-manno-octulosonic-acid transferase [Pasteurella bettyae]
MLRFIYSLVMYLLQPFVWLFIVIRSLKAPNYRKRINERYGFYPSQSAPKAKGIIIHAASVGEVIAATPLVRRIQQQYPELAITMTTVTPTGSDRVKSAFGDSVTHVYLPYDLPDALNRFINFIQPKACIVIETEIWPNLIRQLHKRNIPFIIANARLSARSAKRYGWVKNLLHRMFNEISLIAAQDDISGKRYLNLGYQGDLQLTGNIKYDLVITDELSQKIVELNKNWINGRPVWIAASTHEGEEEIILQAHHSLLAKFPNLLLILVPRHPERFKPVEDLIIKGGFRYCLRSENFKLQEDTQVLLGDTMGELMLLYGVSDIAFVGGSLVKHGGHNPLEPLAFKLPVISGRYTFNFPEVFAKLREVCGVLEINENPTALYSAVEKFLLSEEARQRYGNAGHEVLIENRGALQRLLNLLKPYLEK